MRTFPIDVQAIVRVIATKKFKVLLPSENFKTTAKLVSSLNYPADVLEAVVRENVQNNFMEAFRERMKNDPALKKQIGGIAWEVEVTHVDYDKELYTPAM